MISPHCEKSGNFRNLLAGFILAVFLVYLFTLFHHMPTINDDVWWHLAMGREIVENFQVPLVDPFPFTGAAKEWTFTQWLGSSIFYLAYRAGGYGALKLTGTALMLSAVLVFMFYARRKLSFAVLIFINKKQRRPPQQYRI